MILLGMNISGHTVMTPLCKDPLSRTTIIGVNQDYSTDYNTPEAKPHKNSNQWVQLCQQKIATNYSV